MSGLVVQLSPGDIEAIATAVARQLAKAPKAALLTPEQVATRTGLSLKALERRRSRNQPPLSVRRGRRVYYMAAAVDDYIAGTQS